MFFNRKYRVVLLLSKSNLLFLNDDKLRVSSLFSIYSIFSQTKIWWESRTCSIFCTPVQVSQETLVQYVHFNRLYNTLMIQHNAKLIDHLRTNIETLVGGGLTSDLTISIPVWWVRGVTVDNSNPDDSSNSVEDQITIALVKAGVISCNEDNQCDDDKKVFVDMFKALSFSIIQFQPSI